MNIILFEADEQTQMLQKTDVRARHLNKVLRKKAGDDFDAGIIGGKRGKGRIEHIDTEGNMRLSLNCTEAAPIKSGLSLALGFPRPIQLRRLLRDLTSMGLSRIDLVLTDLGEKSYRDSNLFQNGGDRQAMREGLEQARDTVYPTLKIWASLDELLGQKNEEQAAFFAADNAPGAGPLFSLLQQNTKEQLNIFVGSERGWSERERRLFDEHHIPRASMGSRAMRTECAAIVASALALECLGFLG